MQRSARSVIEEFMHPKDAGELIEALDRAGYDIELRPTSPPGWHGPRDNRLSDQD